MSSLEHITLNHFDLEETRNLVQQQGVAIIPSYVSGEQLEALNAEFETMIQKVLAGEKIKGCVHREFNAGTGISVQREGADTSVLPMTISFFDNPVMEELKNKYMGASASFNDVVYVANDVVGTHHYANDLHFDVLPTLKFFIYLTDTTAANGAFSCIPGTNQETIKIREKYGKNISFKNRELTRISEREKDAIPVESNAGTLIIFTTDVWHKAGTVSEGERRIIRGHCRKPKHQPSKIKSLVKKIFFN